MYGQHDDMMGLQRDDDHTRLIFNHLHYQKHQSAQPSFPLDLSLSTENRYSTSSRVDVIHSHQLLENVPFQNNSALPRQQHHSTIQSGTRLTEDNYHVGGRGLPIDICPDNSSHRSEYWSPDNANQGLKSEAALFVSEPEMLSSKYGASLTSQSFVGTAQSQADKILNSRSAGTDSFHFNWESRSAASNSGSASSVFRQNANLIKNMQRVPSSTPKNPKLTEEDCLSTQQLESPLPSFSPQSYEGASVLRNNAAILKKIKKKLPSYDEPVKINSPVVSGFKERHLEMKRRCVDDIAGNSCLHFGQVDKDIDHGINSVFDTNLLFLTKIQHPPSPVPSLAESSGKSSGSCDSNFGIKELLMLPSTYSDLSLFQKKYFPTNDYAENKHINVRINNYCDNFKNPEIKTEAKDFDFKMSSSCKETSNLDQESKVKISTSTNIMSEKNRTVKLENCPNISFEKNTSVCDVCGDKAAGFYCGAFVCEACKKFFMRAAKLEKVKYKCLKDGNCTITKDNRIQCQYCRYQTCVKLNMFCPGNDRNQKKGRINSNIACQVCGAQSSGFHFGALTCEGCKGFFRRMAKERSSYSYICSKENKCLVSLSTRNGCKACRYQKCISVGMSISSSRIGRQPNAVKHALSLAVQKQTVAPILSSSSSSSLSSSSTSCSTSTSLSTSTSVVSSPKASSPTVSSTNTSTLLLATLPMIQKEKSSADNVLSMSTSELIIKIREAGEALKPINTVGGFGRSEYTEKTTDYKIMWKELMKMFIYHSKCVITFSKKIPGLRSLDIQTQVLLIQLSCYTVILLQLSLNYDVNSKELNFFNLSKEEMEAVLEYFPNFEPVRSHLHHVGTMVQTLSLDFTEICLISALLIIHEDNTKLHERETLRQMQDKISECLRTYEEESYDNGTVRYGVLLLRLGEFSLASLQYGQALVGLETLYPDLEYPQLFTEMMIH